MADAPPSAFLPSLHPLPALSLLTSSLFRLSASLQPFNTLIDLRHPLSDLTSGSVPAGEAAKAAQIEEEEDEFERGYTRGWLERVVAVGARALAKGDEGWEEVVDGASGLLAFLSGPSAQGSSSKTYLLPFAGYTPPSLSTPPPTRPSSTLPSRSASPTPSPSSSSTSADLAMTIHETTLLQNSTGHRTWGSAPLLAQRLASSPSSFFPRLPSSTSEPSSAARPLRVLELGSGTGLVGLSAAAVLARSGIAASVTLTDGGAEPLAVLDNLRANVAANAAILGGVEVRVEELDWREFLGEGKTVAEEEKFDVVLAADVAYEPGMAEALHAAVSGLLRFPAPSSSCPSSPTSYMATTPPSSPLPAFHLIIPLRPTHTAESSTVARLFPPPSFLSELVKLDPSTRRLFRLVAREMVELTGPDGFGGGGGRARRGRAEGEMRYCLRRVEWEEVRDLS